jgi:hypothetical protein
MMPYELDDVERAVLDGVVTGECDACGLQAGELVHHNENNSSGVEGTFCKECRGEQQ